MVIPYAAGAHHHCGKTAMRIRPSRGKNSLGSALAGCFRMTFVRQKP